MSTDSKAASSLPISRMLKKYEDVAAGVKACASHMGPWSLGDISLGLRHVQGRHDSQDITDAIPGNPISLASNPDLYQYLRRECAVASAAYAIPDANAIAAKAQLASVADVLHVQKAAARFKPAFVVLRDAEAGLIRVVVRGTADLYDVFTDIAGHWGPVPGGNAHYGFLKSAEWLLEQTVPLLQSIPNDEPPRYSLRFSGHSLGAGTAALATFLFRTQPGRYPTLLAAFPRSQVDCFCASAPPVLSHSLARATADYITTLTLGHDVVARASVANLEGLRLEILQSRWWEDMEDQVRKSQIVQNVKAVLERLGAHSLVDLARTSARALAGSDRPRPKPNAGTPEMTANGPADRLNEGDACTGSGAQPTVEGSTDSNSEASSHANAAPQGRPKSKRERARGVAGAIYRTGPKHLTDLAASAASAAKHAAKHAAAAASGARRGGDSERGGDHAHAERACTEDDMPDSFEEEQSKLDAIAETERMYSPGRLLHLRRPPRSAGGRRNATAAPDPAGIPAAPDVAGGSPPSPTAGLASDGERASEAEDAASAERALDLDDMILVDGEPVDERFKFIAVRSTWLSDHSLATVIRALEVARERCDQ